MLICILHFGNWLFLLVILVWAQSLCVAKVISATTPTVFSLPGVLWSGCYQQGVRTEWKPEPKNERKKNYFLLEWKPRRNVVYYFVQEQNWKKKIVCFLFEWKVQVFQESFQLPCSEVGDCRLFAGIKSPFVSLVPSLLQQACYLLRYSPSVSMNRAELPARSSRAAGCKAGVAALVIFYLFIYLLTCLASPGVIVVGGAIHSQGVLRFWQRHTQGLSMHVQHADFMEAWSVLT